MNVTNETIVNKSIGFLDNVFSGIVSKLVVAAIIVLIGLILGKLLGKLIHRLLSDMKIDKTLRKATGIKIPIEDMISAFATYFIYFIAAIMALNHLGVTTGILNIISVAIMIVIVLSVFLGIKDWIPNAISGIIIHKKDFLHEGDKIEIDNIKGKIIHINLIETKVETKSGDIICIPNSHITKSKVVKKKR